MDIGGNSTFNMNVRNLSINIFFSGDVLMNIGDSGNILMFIFLSSDVLMNIGDSFDVLMNVRDSLDILMNVFLSSDIFMNVRDGSRGNLSSIVIRVHNDGGGMDNRGGGS